MDRQNTIMIVDDTEINIAILVDALKDEYMLIVAVSGPKAIEILKGETPDLILLDIMMPEMNGYEVLNKIKQKPTLEHIPIILLSAITYCDFKSKGFSLGAVDYITKPFEISEVRLELKHN